MINRTRTLNTNIEPSATENAIRLSGCARTSIIVLGMLLLGGTTGCGQHAPSATPSPSSTTTAERLAPAAGLEKTVRVARPLRKTIQHAIEQPGFDIQAFEVTPLYPRIAGYIHQWNVDMGDRIKKDAVLATLYVPEREAELAQKEAAVRQAASQIDQAKATVLTAEAQLARTHSQYERLTRIGKTSGVLDQESIDEARLGYEAAKANVVKTRADVTAAESRLKVAEADRDYARTMLQYREIRAPYDGVVTQRNLNKGDFVQPASTSGVKGEPLFVVNQIDPVRVFVNVPGSDAQFLKDGDPVVLRLQGAGGEVLRGRVTRNARSLDPQSRTLRTEIDLPNPGGKLLPGMYVQATISVQHEYVWALPASALVTEGEQTFAYRVESGKAVRTLVQIGLKGNGDVEIVSQQTAGARAVAGAGAGGSASAVWTPISGDEEFVASGGETLAGGQAVRAITADKDAKQN